MAYQYDKYKVTLSQYASLVYHDIFNYPLTQVELDKWQYAADKKIRRYNVYKYKDYYLLYKRKTSVLKRLKNSKYSKKKYLIANKATNILKLIPTIDVVAVSGSLAMLNAPTNADIDLMIITKSGWLWTSRALSLVILKLAGFSLRKANDKNEKNKLCLNVWIDRNNLTWLENKRNIYTAHEIAQVVPLFSRNETYELFLFKNRWIIKYWPKAVRTSVFDILETKKQRKSHTFLFASLSRQVKKGIEGVAFRLQYSYMKSKISKEVVQKDLALFHPHDWNETITRIMSNFV